MNWLILSCALTIGYLPTNATAINNYRVEASECFEQTVYVNATAFDHISLWGSIETYDFNFTGLQFFPFRSDYSVGFELYDKNIAIGIMHECDHPVIFQPFQFQGLSANITEAYIRFSFSTK